MGRPLLLVQALRSYASDLEDRLTEVFAVALDSSPAFAWALLSDFGIDIPADRVTVRTQEGFADQRRLVDLVLRAVEQSGEICATVFIESKYNPHGRLGAYWFSADQTIRQRKALDAQPGRLILAGIASRSDVELLEGPAATRPYDPRRDGCDALLTWDRVRALANSAGGQKGWEEAARSGSASASERMLLEFITYLDQRGDAVAALDDDDVFVLGREARARERIDRVIERAAELLAAQLDVNIDLDNIDADRGIPNGSRRAWVPLLPPATSWLEGRPEAALSIMVADAALDEEGSVGVPHVYVGFGWNAGREGRDVIREAGWDALVATAELELYWEDRYCNLYAGKPLVELAREAETVADQARVLADWAESTVKVGLGLEAPPDPDRQRRRARRK